MKSHKEDSILDLNSFEAFQNDHVSKVSKIAKELMAQHKLSIADSLKIATQIHRNIVLEQALCAGGTKKPNPLEMIAMKLGANSLGI